MKVTSAARRSMRQHLVAAIVVTSILIIGVAGWGATAVISGAVVASGSLVVDSNVKKVQHLTGGIVGELRVRDGDRVRAGDIVVRLDETVTRAILGIRARGGIVVVIAHRPSAIAGVDLLLVLKQGRMQAFGPKDEILSKVLQRDAPAPRPLKVVSDIGGSASP